MSLIHSIIVALSSGIVVGAALVITFHRIQTGRDHEPLQDAYLRCDGDWHEAHLNDCCDGLKTFPQQPVNAYTSLAYLITGVFVTQYVNSEPGHVFMVSMCFLAFGSALYHGLSVKWAGHLDVLAIYWVFGGLVLYTVGRLFAFREQIIAVAMFLLAGVAAAFLRLLWKETGVHKKVAIVLGPLLVLDLTYVWWNRVLNGCWMILTAFVFFAIAFVVWNRDVNKKFVVKRWGHGVWHICTGLGIAILFYVIAHWPPTSLLQARP